MVENWKECKLGDVGSIVTGKTPSSKNPEDWGFQMPFVTPSDYKNYGKFALSSERSLSNNGILKLQSKILPENSVMVTCIGSDMGKVAMNKIPVITNQQINSLIPKSEIIDSNFLYYGLVSLYEILRVYGSDGTAIPIINKNDFSNLDISLPPLQEQKAIAEILSSLDDKIDLLHRQNHTLESLAQTLFRQWFIEEAKENRTGKFKDWIEDTIGGDWGKENPTEEFKTVVHCIRGTDIADLNNGLPTRTPLRYIKNKKLENIELKEGDIIFEISGGTENQSTGRTTYINQEIKQLFKHPIVFSNFCRLIRPKKKEYFYFIYLYFQYLYANDEFFGLENGTSGIKNLNYKALLNDLEYQMPTEAKVLEFHNNAKNFFQKIGKNKLQIQTLENLRDTLLPKLISGEVRVGA